MIAAAESDLAFAEMYVVAGPDRRPIYRSSDGRSLRHELEFVWLAAVEGRRHGAIG